MKNVRDEVPPPSEVDYEYEVCYEVFDLKVNKIKNNNNDKFYMLLARRNGRKWRK